MYLPNKETSASLVLHVLFPFKSGTECSAQGRARAHLQSQLPETQQNKTKHERITCILEVFWCILMLNISAVQSRLRSLQLQVQLNFLGENKSFFP